MCRHQFPACQITINVSVVCRAAVVASKRFESVRGVVKNTGPDSCLDDKGCAHSKGALPSSQKPNLVIVFCFVVTSLASGLSTLCEEVARTFGTSYIYRVT